MMTGELVANEICPRWGCPSDHFGIVVWHDAFHVTVECMVCGAIFPYDLS